MSTECADRNARVIIDRLKSNLKFLYNQMPEKDRAESGLWYDGVRTMVDDRAAKYGYNDASVAAVYATLSPSMDWYQNVYNADRIMEIYATQQDHEWDDDMEKTSVAIWKKPKNQKLQDNTKLIKAVRGKKLSELDSPLLKGMWIRTYDQAHSDRAFREVRPDGSFGDFIYNKPKKKSETRGPKATSTWQSTTNVRNAVAALEAKGDRDKLSPLLGAKHKVRSFYNNILDPHAANGDVTIDTHAVGAALLMPGGNKSVMVAHNFADSVPKGGEAASHSIVTGLSGTYSIFATAYRELAAELHIEPRQLQSITWVEKRKVLGESLSEKQEQRVRDAWSKYNTDTSVPLESVQKEILAIGKETRA